MGEKAAEAEREVLIEGIVFGLDLKHLIRTLD